MVAMRAVLEGVGVALTCAVCGKPVEDETAYRDEAGNARCTHCAPRAAAGGCDGGGRQVREEPSNTPGARQAPAITDVPEPGLGWGAAAAAAVAGVVAGVFTESLAVALLAGVLVFGAHWLLMRASDE